MTVFLECTVALVLTSSGMGWLYGTMVCCLMSKSSSWTTIDVMLRTSLSGGSWLASHIPEPDMMAKHMYILLLSWVDQNIYFQSELDCISDMCKLGTIWPSADVLDWSVFCAEAAYGVGVNILHCWSGHDNATSEQTVMHSAYHSRNTGGCFYTLNLSYWQ